MSLSADLSGLEVINTTPNSSIFRLDDFAPIISLFKGEGKAEGNYLKISKDLVRKANRYVRSDLKGINPKHRDILLNLSTKLTPEEKKKYLKLLSKYFTAEFINNPNGDLSAKSFLGKVHSCLLLIIILALSVRAKRDQTLVMTSNITRNVTRNYFDLDVPLIPSEFKDVKNFNVFLNDPKIIRNAVFNFKGDEYEDYCMSISKKHTIEDNFLINFNDNFDSFFISTWIRDKTCYLDCETGAFNEESMSLDTSNNCLKGKSFKDITFLELELTLIDIQDRLAKIDEIENWDEKLRKEAARLTTIFRGLVIIKLLAVGLHTHSDVNTSEVTEFLKKVSDLRKYPENVTPIRKSVDEGEEVIVNESEANSFRVVRMPQGSVKLIGFEIPEGYDPSKKTTITPHMKHYWVLNRETGVKERVLRPVREYKRNSQCRKGIYVEEG